MILVTGAGGHLGANLVRALLETGQAVRVLIRSDDDMPAVVGLPVEVARGDLRDKAAMAGAMQGIRRVHHCAAKVSTNNRDRGEIFGCNVIGTRTLLRAALDAAVEKVVVTGSFSAVGWGVGGVSNEDDPFDPLQRHLAYGHTKAAVEHECLKAHAEGLPVVVAISTAILGPNDYKPSRMGRVLIRFAQGKLHAYVPGGFPFVAARDIVQGHLLAMDKGRPGQRYIFASAFKTFDEIMALFSSVTGQAKPRFRLPPAVMSVAAEIASVVMPILRPNTEQLLTPGAIDILTMHRHADITKARTELGFEPSSIAAAVQDAYDWFVGQGMIVAPAPRGALIKDVER